MKNILVFFMVLVSLQVYAGTGMDNQKKQPINIELEKGNSSDDDTHPRNLIPVTCVYADGMVQLTLLDGVGEFTLTVTTQNNGERWSVRNVQMLSTSTASGTYWVEIEMDDGSIYWGSYTL